MLSRLLPLLLVSLVTRTLLAQSPPQSPEPDPSSQGLLARIEQLEKRIAELEDHERKQATTTPPADSSFETGAGIKSVEAGASPTAASHSEHMGNAIEERETQIHYPSLQIRGFGDVDFSATDQKGSVSGFDLGQFVLHFASPLSQKVSYSGEVSFTAQPNTYELNVERTIIRYDYNDYFKMSFGKYHTPIGYWNTAFHHGGWLQTTIDRPQIGKVGGTFIPVPFVALHAAGNTPPRATALV